MPNLFDKAEALASDDKALARRLRQAAGCLIDELRPQFSGQPVDCELRSMTSKDGKYRLQWVNKGTSSIGTVYCVVAFASLGAASGI